MKREPAIVDTFRNEKGGLIKDVDKLVSSYPRVPITVDCVIFGLIMMN